MRGRATLPLVFCHRHTIREEVRGYPSPLVLPFMLAGARMLAGQHPPRSSSTVFQGQRLNRIGKDW
jgi:hypothetical protein